MFRVKWFGGTFVTFAACALASASLSSAAGPFYVSPTGTGFDCSPTNPCGLENASSLAAAGEQILMAPGSYNLSGNLSLSASLAPATPGTRPEIHTNLGRTILQSGANSVIRDLRFVVSNLPAATYALNLQAGTARAERVEVIVSGASSPFAARAVGGATITDSVLSATGTDAVAVATGNTGATLRNVTAIATGLDSNGLATNPSYMATTDPQVVTVQNSIIRGDGFGFFVSADATHPVTVNVDHGNYPATNSVTSPAVLNDPGPFQTTPPAFVSPATGDFHQLTASPTRDAGALVIGLSATDLDGQMRHQGTAPDIGADEFNLLPVLIGEPKPKCKKGRKLKKVKGKFKCVKKKKRKKK